ncbi:uncharacterized protein LOC125515542 [Triticum urartu]|uniref:Uncharacterized protein n=1 Tax=Triticum urartu TaxID=4572 RepID=A0A8R7QMV9_TRIUA|nr:uncharacterized protein LOC125515542 [Triticum urartu]
MSPPASLPPPAPAGTPLADLLESATFAPPAPAPPPPTPAAILSAWSHLRSAAPSPAAALAALETLHLHRRSLRLSSAHLELLLPLLPLHPRLVSPLLATCPRLLPNYSLPFASLPLAPRLLLLGALATAKTSKNSTSNGSSGSPSTGNLGSDHGGDDPVVAVSRILENMEQTSETSDGIDHLALAGIGHALACADELHFGRILVSLVRICGRIGDVGVAVRVLKLVDWLVSGFVESRRMRKVQVLFEVISPEKCESEGYVLFPAVMAACGGLRALRVASVRHRLDFAPRLKEAPERTIRFAARRAAVEGRPDDDQRHVLLQCVALGLTQCGPVASNDSVLRCVLMALLEELLPLPRLLRISVKSPDENSAELAKNQVMQHQDSVLFKEAGPVTGVLCNQYSFADEKTKDYVETRVCEYAQELYHHLRAAVLLHQAKRNGLLAEIDKIAEAAFFMIVSFAAEVAKHRLDANSSGGFQPEVAVRILVEFSCVEHLRRLRLPEYTEAIRRAVVVNQDNAAASALFVESMPSCAELTTKPDLLTGTRYICYTDEVQTSRILFYLRVMPTCINLIPTHLIRDKLSPVIFLYIQHSNEKITRAVHSVMVSFLSSGNDTDQDDRVALKEQLAFDYIRRSLEAYPGVTPFDGLASGVAALVRHLPAKSPAILFCIHSLVVKAKDLCSTAMIQDRSLWRSWEESTEPCKKILDLLLRLIFLADIQSFSYLLKELAEFVTSLPKEGQDVLLDDMHAHVAESDDVVRKPVLVSWLQSLSYISSQADVRESRNNAKNARSAGGVELSLNRTIARL